LSGKVFSGVLLQGADLSNTKVMGSQWLSSFTYSSKLTVANDHAMCAAVATQAQMNVPDADVNKMPQQQHDHPCN
jgi:hypothetical protein